MLGPDDVASGSSNVAPLVVPIWQSRADLRERCVRSMAFLLPAIPWLIGAIFATAAVVTINELLSDKAEKKTFAIIGDSKSGKTTFTKLLAQGIFHESDYARTVATTTHKGSTITLKNGTKLHVGELKDLPGEPSAWLSWKQRVQESDYVLYLLRSHLLRSGVGTTRERCRRDLKQLKMWLEELDKDARPPVLLVFSFRDKDDKGNGDSVAYADELIRLAELKAVVTAVGHLTPVRIVAGSLASEEAAIDLLNAVGEEL